MAISLAVAIDVDAPFAELAARAVTAESLGFSTVYVPDHSRPWRHDPVPGGLWFDGWTALAALATATTTIGVGTLVTNPVLRPPGLVAREALAVDHLSGGRLRLGVGTGIAGWDHEAAGTPYWPLGERLARFREYVAFVGGCLRGGSFAFDGTYHSGTLTGLPAPVQAPRPPITVAGASKVVRAVAVERAECWNTHGAFDVAPEELPRHLAALNADVTVRCEAAGRDPATLSRSVLLLDALWPWRRAGRLAELVEQMAGLGFDEVVVFWPWTDEDRVVFDADAGEVARLSAQPPAM